MDGYRIPPRDRALAWLVTGPVGHLAGGLYDWFGAVARIAYARARGRRLG